MSKQRRPRKQGQDNQDNTETRTQHQNQKPLNLNRVYREIERVTSQFSEKANNGLRQIKFIRVTTWIEELAEQGKKPSQSELFRKMSMYLNEVANRCDDSKDRNTMLYFKRWFDIEANKIEKANYSHFHEPDTAIVLCNYFK